MARALAADIKTGNSMWYCPRPTWWTRSTRMAVLSLPEKYCSQTVRVSWPVRQPGLR